MSELVNVGNDSGGDGGSGNGNLLNSSGSQPENQGMLRIIADDFPLTLRQLIKRVREYKEEDSDEIEEDEQEHPNGVVDNLEHPNGDVDNQEHPDGDVDYQEHPDGDGDNLPKVIVMETGHKIYLPVDWRQHLDLNVLLAFRALNPNPNTGDFDVKIANDGRAKLIIGFRRDDDFQVKVSYKEQGFGDVNYFDQGN